MSALITPASAIIQSQDERHCHCTFHNIPPQYTGGTQYFPYTGCIMTICLYSATQPAPRVWPFHQCCVYPDRMHYQRIFGYLLLITVRIDRTRFNACDLTEGCSPKPWMFWFAPQPTKNWNGLNKKWTANKLYMMFIYYACNRNVILKFPPPKKCKPYEDLTWIRWG